MKLPSTKPYFIRALYDWCDDNGFTPHVSARVDSLVKVPREHVRDGQIVLDISTEATDHLILSNEEISFQARFNGVPHDIVIPMTHVTLIYANENKTGMAFEFDPADVPSAKKNTPNDSDSDSDSPPRPSGPPTLRVVK